MSSIYKVEPLVQPLSKEAVRDSATAFDDRYVIKTLLELSDYLISREVIGRLAGTPTITNRCTPDLATLSERLRNGRYGPTPLPAELVTDAHKKAQVFERTQADVTQRPLADFEDLYYAAVASLKALHQWLVDYTRSGFHRVTSPTQPTGETIGELQESITAYWKVLNDPACGKTIDDAVREARYKAIQQEVLRVVDTNGISPIEGKLQLSKLDDLHIQGGIEGMWFLNGWAPAMIAVSLQQKYNSLLSFEKDEADLRTFKDSKAQKSRITKKRSYQALAGQLSSKKYSTRNPRKAAAQHSEQLMDDISYTFTETPSTEKVSKSATTQSDLAHHSAEGSLMYKEQPFLPQQPEPLRSSWDVYRQEMESRQANEWNNKKQRVSAYKEYLRSLASPGVRTIACEFQDTKSRLSRTSYMDNVSASGYMDVFYSRHW